MSCPRPVGALGRGTLSTASGVGGHRCLLARAWGGVGGHLDRVGNVWRLATHGRTW